jgi:hypothetical protein
MDRVNAPGIVHDNALNQIEDVEIVFLHRFLVLVLFLLLCKFFSLRFCESLSQINIPGFNPLLGSSVYAFCRVHNEARMFRRMLASIEHVFYYGVIGYENCTDGSNKIAHEFCHRHPGSVCVQYPYGVLPPFDK